MAAAHSQRLTALDTAFLGLESPGVHMHVGSVGIFEPGPLATADGGIDFERVLEVTGAALPKVPRFRQRLARAAVTGHPAWVDDAHFNPRYHVRHTALPSPGDTRQLKRLVGRIMSQRLDREKPLWELWFVERLEGGRFAVVSKVHHCLTDGISGVDLLAAFMGPDADRRPAPEGLPWRPRAAPGSLRLLLDDLWRRTALPGRLLTATAQRLSQPGGLEEAAHAATGLLGALANLVSPASETPLNVPIGPHRRFDWTQMELDAIREIRERLGGTLNDVVLAVVAGAARRYLGDRGVDTAELDFRALVPVSTRTRAQRGTLGNRIAMLVTPLPASEPDPRRRLSRVARETARLKDSGQAEASEVVEEIGDWTTPSLITGLTRMAPARRAYNVVVTNVPGPATPVFLDGARLLQAYPLVPLFEKQGLGIALFSYADSLYWGFNADWEAVPDLHDFVLAVDRELEILRKA